MFGAPALTKAGSPGRPGSPCGEGTEAEMGQTHQGSQGPSVSLPSPCCGAGGGTQPPATTHLLSSAASGSGWPLRGDSVSPGRGTHEVPSPRPQHRPTHLRTLRARVPGDSRQPLGTRRRNTGGGGDGQSWQMANQGQRLGWGWRASGQTRLQVCSGQTRPGRGKPRSAQQGPS